MIWVGRLICVALVLQAIEMFWVPPWTWELMAAEVFHPLRPLLRRLRPLLAIQLLAALAALAAPSSWIILTLIATHWLICLRWRGTFNGGSDFMTFQILAAWLLASIFPKWTDAALTYVAIQAVLSFFAAGCAKIVNPQWRDGQALEVFLRRQGIDLSLPICFLASWGVLAFELAFPLAFAKPVPFISLAVGFQIANVYIFGLNRFLFAWLPGYSALYLVAQTLH